MRSLWTNKFCNNAIETSLERHGYWICLQHTLSALRTCAQVVLLPENCKSHSKKNVICPHLTELRTQPTVVCQLLRFSPLHFCTNSAQKTTPRALPLSPSKRATIKVEHRWNTPKPNVVGKLQKGRERHRRHGREELTGVKRERRTGTHRLLQKSLQIK